MPAREISLGTAIVTDGYSGIGVVARLVVVAALASKSIRSGLRSGVDFVHCGDGILAELGVVNIVVPQQICSIGRAPPAERPQDVATNVHTPRQFGPVNSSRWVSAHSCTWRTWSG